MQGVSMISFVLLQLANALWGWNILFYYTRHIRVPKAYPTILHYYRILPSDTTLNEIDPRTFTMPTECIYHLPQSTQCQLACLSLAQPTGMFYIFRRHWVKQCYTMNEKAVFQVTGAIDHELWCVLMTSSIFGSSLKSVYYTWHSHIWL